MFREAPFLASRYDVETGEVLPVSERIGLLDRKLRAVNENTRTEEEWLKWAFRAFGAITHLFANPQGCKNLAVLPRPAELLLHLFSGAGLDNTGIRAGNQLRCNLLIPPIAGAKVGIGVRGPHDTALRSLVN